MLNARYHEQEAFIVAQAGVPGAVTIATNMAGRGTDIQLGGNLDMRIQQELGGHAEGPERDSRRQNNPRRGRQAEGAGDRAGGLYVLGTERHESRRIDNQLRGRSGRQGDPGHSKFFLSLQDDLMRIFGSERMDRMLQKLGLKEGEAIIHPWINKAIENAQQKVEARNFDIRKNLLKFDDVMNDQRKVIFEQRIELMAGRERHRDDHRHAPRSHRQPRSPSTFPRRPIPSSGTSKGSTRRSKQVLNLDLPIARLGQGRGYRRRGGARAHPRRRPMRPPRPEPRRSRRKSCARSKRRVLLQTLDHLWREHLVTLDHLRQVVGFRGYAQRDPLNEYKTEAFELFESMLADLPPHRVDASVTGRTRPAPAPARRRRTSHAVRGDPHRSESPAKT